MPSPKLLIFLVFWLSFSSALNNETKNPNDTYNDGSSSTVPAACGNCNICPYLCQAQVPPPPPPAQLPQAPPAQASCPPPPPGQGDQVVCCQNSPPVPYFFNPNNNPNNNPGNSPPIQVSLEHKIKPSTATWLSAVFFIFISITVRV